MLQSKYIIQGWKNLLLDIISDLKYKSIFDERLKICDSCEFSKSGFCSVCGCYLKAKTKSEDSVCPKKKWDTVKNTISKSKGDS